MEFRCAAVFGLGLIGGSIARDLSAQGVRVLGYDHDAECIRSALAAGSIAATVDPTSDRLGEADVVILALPVSAAPELLEELLPRIDGAQLITDVGSTKATISRAAEHLGLRDRFVGSHPLCGDHRSGWPASRQGLFKKAKVFICPVEERNSAALKLAEDLWTNLGGEPVSISPEAHDTMISWVSHLPQLTATALALTLSEAGFDRSALGPGGLDMTRLAGSSPDVWNGILRENRENALVAVSKMMEQLEAVRVILAESDHEGMDFRLRAARDWTESHIPCNSGSSTTEVNAVAPNQEDT